MCGIFLCMLSTDNHICPASDNKCNCSENVCKSTCEDMLKRRGPNISSNLRVNNIKHEMYFSGHVLWQRGSIAKMQPIENESGVLLYNGDVFGGSFMCFDNSWNDTEVISKALTSSSKTFCEIINEIEGPYSIIYWDKIYNKVYFGRDQIGRHSLLFSKTDGNIVITSVAKKSLQNICEVPALGIFCVNLNDDSWSLFPWVPLQSKIALTVLESFQEILGNSIYVHDHIPNRKSSTINREDCFHFEELTVAKLSNEALFIHLLQNSSISKVTDDLIRLLNNSVQQRTSRLPPYCKNCINKPILDLICDHPKVGVLFSGGLDCSILALLADKYIPQNEPIDLINVSFERVRNNKLEKDYSNSSDLWNVPDRGTGLQTVQELRKLRPNRTWNFIEINVSRLELNHELMHIIGDLLYPLNSVLDESLGAALWFASRSKGFLRKQDEHRNITFTEYISPCRVLLMGMGADELFGGYSKHRAAFKRGGWEELNAELVADLEKIPYRNLGRDDRVIADNGVQGRTPYLEENFLNFVQNLKPYERCCPLLPIGVGDKILLRLTARKLGLQKASMLPKRALQFGSRIADSKQNAGDHSKKL